jgi:hypothetical protein
MGITGQQRCHIEERKKENGRKLRRRRSCGETERDGEV